MNHDPETQATVVAKALTAYGFNAVQGKKVMRDKVTVRGANETDRGIIKAVASEYAKGFTVDIRKIQTYFIVSLEVPSATPPVHTEARPLGSTAYD